MHITESIEIIDLALYLPSHKTLVIADSHIGYEEYLQKQGVMIPYLQFKDILQRLEKIFSAVAVEQIIFNGDIKHEFGEISRQEWKETLALLDFLQKHGKVVLIKGNHDTILGPLAERKSLEIMDYIIIDNILITHGHKMIEAKEKYNTIIIAHEHPAISFRERPSEKFKCFLKGKYKNKELIVMPSLLQTAAGTDLIKEERLSPYLKQSLDSFEAYIVEDKVYYFGNLRNLV